MPTDRHCKPPNRMPITPRTSSRVLACIRRRRCGAFAVARKSTAAEYIRRRQRIGRRARRNIARVFADVDVLVTPTMPMPAPSIAALKTNPEQLRPAELKLLRNTRPFNVWGLPAISVPCGFTQGGLPIGCRSRGRTGVKTWSFVWLMHMSRRRPGISVVARYSCDISRDGYPRNDLQQPRLRDHPRVNVLTPHTSKQSGVH